MVKANKDNFINLCVFALNRINKFPSVAFNLHNPAECKSNQVIHFKLVFLTPYKSMHV